MKSDLLLQLQKLTKLIAESHTISGYKLLKSGSNSIEISVDSAQLTSLQQICNTNGITYTDGLDSVIIDTQLITANFNIFIGIEEVKRFCRQKYNTQMIPDLSNLFVVEDNGTYLITENNALVESSSIDFNLIQYLSMYFRFAHRMREISNYFDEVTHTCILFTSNKGVVKIALGDIDLKKVVEYRLLLDRICSFEEEIKDARKLDFIKSAIIDHVEHSEERDITTLLSRLSNIIEDSIRNHQLYMEEFTFEKFKTQWEKERELYFQKIRDILQKVSTMTANLPIALIAFVISSNDKITKHSIEVVFFLMFLTYVGVSLWVQILNRKDIELLDNDLEKDAQVIEEKCSETFKSIRDDFDIMRDKAHSILKISELIIVVFSLISALTLCLLIKSLLNA